MSIVFPTLCLPKPKLKIVSKGKQYFVWDNLRAKYLLLTPEEWVRQHIISYLISACGVAEKSIVQEFPVSINGTPQRADIVVVDSSAKPIILVECKASNIVINEHTAEQAMRYNSILGAKYVILSNGLKHYCYQKTDNGYITMQAFPHI